MSRYPSDDIDLLVPSFAAEVRIVMQKLKDGGFDPVPFDTLRTPAQALRNAKRGTGVLNSMHLYGVACDMICGEHGWKCRKHKCDFFNALGVAVRVRGLTWGGAWLRRDYAHFQAIPVWQQNTIRRLKSFEEREAFVASRLAKRKL